MAKPNVFYASFGLLKARRVIGEKLLPYMLLDLTYGTKPEYPGDATFLGSSGN